MRFSRLTFATVLAGTSLPAMASEGGGGAQALLTPHIGTMFWTLITFLFMVVVLGRFAWKPMLGALGAREKAIQDSIDQARKDREDAEALVAEQRELLAEAHRQRSEAAEHGRKEAERLKGEILDQANQQREQLLRQTEEQVRSELRQARAELKAFTADLAIGAAERLLARNLDDGTQRKLVDEYLADLERG
jgi:F-type H+-transporting ATPase subunit b